ncbi:MAG: hypothetical protein F2735_05000 [Actinobacteria bacterium]|uniref:Unannotated protein n=1 Tax=freshwater metagenome TaxID=449393 RepID=A0A6J6XTI4_9ZZZZ|nr:hypothetical protein [Actinomycetota bacterium]
MTEPNDPVVPIDPTEADLSMTDPFDFGDAAGQATTGDYSFSFADRVPAPPSGDGELRRFLPAPVSRLGRAIFGRAIDWIDAPWTFQRIVQALTAFVMLLVAGIITLNVVHWDLITSNNTPTGGDMGAHVLGPAYLRDHLLSNFRLSGWNPSWYDGFPLYRFYMVIPALMIVLVNVVLPYGIAFKLIAVIGILTLPLCCWAFGRLARFVFPIPELFALAALIFLLDESFSIYGGNVKSTMAGEFSFSIALSFAVLGLGLFARGLETGKLRSRTAVILALAVLSHGIVAIFVVIAVALMWLISLDKQRLVYGLAVLVPAMLLTSFWMIPFVNGTPFMTDMKYGKRPEGANDSYWKMFFNLDVNFDRVIFVLAVIGLVGSVVRRHRAGTWLGVCLLALAVLTRLAENSLPVIGLLWNPRVLPFIYLLRYLLMMVGVVELARAAVLVFNYGRMGRALAIERRAGHAGTAVPLPTGRSQAMGGAITALLALVVVGTILSVEFEVGWWGAGRSNGHYALTIGPDNGNQLVVYQKRGTNGRGLSDSWSRYNFTGYESKSAYAEYRALVLAMETIGKDSKYGCGRALWENNGENGKYGTTMALMLLPHWTDGCIGSSEGLFFEASGTTPYHFLTAAAMSADSSNPVRQLRYVNNDPSVGVPHLQKLGIKYYMAWTEKAVAKAETAEGLTLIVKSGPWHIYEVADSNIVVPLSVQPVVVAERPGDQRERWLELGSSWFQNTAEWAAIPAADGPSSWQHITAQVDSSRETTNRVAVLKPTDVIKPVKLDPVVVSNVVMGNETVNFDVDKVGVPVLVKVSYFPNWEVSGAQGPYRVAPNLMVVVPTSKHVRLNFARSYTDYLAYGLTMLGIVLLFVLRKYLHINYRSEELVTVVEPEPPVPSSVDLDYVDEASLRR